MPKIRPIPSNTVEPEPVRVKPGQAEKVPPEYAVEIDLEEEFPQEAQQAASEKGQDRNEAEAGRDESQEGDEGQDREPQALSRQAEEVRQAEENRQRQAAEAERARQAEAQRRAHEQQLAYERRQREQAEHDSLVNALAAANSDLASARAAYVAARQANDFEAEADANDRIAEARQRITWLSGGKDAQEERLQEPEPPPPEPQPQRQPTPNDVINSMTGLMPEERSWLMKHPDLVMSQQGQRRLEVAYYDATDAGLTRGSPEYFQFFNERLGFNDEDDSMPANNPKPARANGAGRQVAAPVSRSGTDVKTGREQVSGSKVTLNPQQREAAKYSGISEEEYAKQLRKLIELKKSGHYQES